MNPFIWLTRGPGVHKILVNINQITTVVSESNGGAYVRFGNLDKGYSVQESVD